MIRDAGRKEHPYGAFRAPSAIATAVTLAALSLAALSPAPAPAAAPGPQPPLGHVGRWITDAKGRAVILHGVNMVYKRPPYEPSAIGFNTPDAKFLHRHGLDTVRLGVIYGAVEPQPGQFDSAYLANIAKTQHQLARQHVFSLLDFHQDLFNEKFTGEGFPAWSVLDNGAPTEPLTGFPGTYFSSPGENAAWDSLWSDASGPGGLGLEERYAAAWRAVAKRFARSGYVMGYDPINEPWPGTAWPTCVNTAGCPAFEKNGLGPLEAKVVQAVREVDPIHTVWYEPVVTDNFGPTYNTPRPNDPNVGFNFHDYCLAAPANPPCDASEQLTVDNAEQYGKTNNVPLLLSEFGAIADLPTIQRMVDRSDRAMISWMWWHYCGCDDPTTSGPGDAQAIVHDPKQPPTGGNVFHEKLAALDRPYPQAVAGTPKSYFYDAGTNRFRLRYSTRAPGGKRLAPGTQTVVYVGRMHYGGSYSAKVSGAKMISPPGARYLRLVNRPGAKDVSVRISPDRASQ